MFYGRREGDLVSPFGFPSRDENGVISYSCPCLCHSGVAAHVVSCDCPCPQCGIPGLFLVEHACGRQDPYRPREERRQKVLGYWDAAHARLNMVLLEEDPAGIVLEKTLQGGEYELEAAAILPQLSCCESVSDVRSLIHREIGRLVDRTTAGPIDSFSRVSDRIWSEVVPILKEGSIPCSTAP